MFIHTIALQNEVRAAGTVTATRKSENRVYTACVVLVVTESSRAHGLALQAAQVAKVEPLRIAMEEALAKTGKTLAEAAEEMSRSYSYNGPRASKEVQAWAAAKGAYYWAEKQASVKVRAVGTEAVLSWHGNVGLAQKAAVSPSDHLTREGFAKTVRTDITVRDTKAAKAS